jgi:hypothetical protein
MKVYEAVFNEAKNKGVWGISLVEDPAMEETFLALSKADSKIELKTLDEEQRIIVGLVLEPDKKVYRNQGGEEFEMFFSKETVKDLMYNFAKQGYQTNSSIEHSGQRIEGVSFTEMWLVRDEKMDTAISLGLNPKEGSWMAVSKIDSDDVWNDYVKTGKVKGYSIDAFVELQEVKLNKDKQMEKTILEEIKDISKAIMLTLNPAKEEVKLGSVNSVDGMVFMYDGETPEVGAAIYIMDADGETKIPLPVGEYALEGDSNLSVVEEGIIASIGVAEAEAPAELADPAPVAAPSAATAADVAAEIKSVLIKYTEDAKAERLEFEKAIKLELETFKGQLVEFSNKPATTKTVSTPTLRQGTKQNYIEFLNNKL